MKPPIDTAGISFIAAGPPEATVDFETKVAKVDESGQPIFGLQVVALTEPPWVCWRLGLLDSNHGVVGLLGSVERCFELCWGDVCAVAV